MNNSNASCSNKRKATTLTLWDAANVHKFKSMWFWWNSIRRRDLNEADTTAVSGVNVSDIQFAKKLNLEPSNGKLMTTFSVGLRPTKQQKVVLNEMLKVSNHAYNWCNYLVQQKQFKPKHFDLQKVVAKTNSEDVDAALRMEGDGWFFDNKMTTIKNTSCKHYSTMYKSAQSNQRKKEVTMKDKNAVNPSQGAFQIPHPYIRLLNEKDTEDIKVLNRYISIMPANFSIRKKHIKERFMKLSKSISKLPPINHDVKISRRVNGKYVLQIPCDPTYTRCKPPEIQPSAMCGIDPGGRTFATIYDPSNVSVYQVGLQEDKIDLTDNTPATIRKLHNKIDKTNAAINLARTRKKTQAVEDQCRHLRKLYLELKTFVKDIHLKLASHLVKNYSYVVLGKIGVASIVKKDGPNQLSKRSKRDLLCWQHYQFRTFLEHRVKDTECMLVIQDESYTSKTCGICGKINQTLGRSETFNCQFCRYETHRDVNGARNILLKALRVGPWV